MKLAVVGCGALGSFYGARILRSGGDVAFVLRSDFEVVRRSGLWVRSGDESFHVRPRCALEGGEIGHCDLVLIGLKTTANDQYGRLLSPLVGPDTILLTLQNGLGNEEQLAALFGGANVLGGLCFVCLNRVEPGLVEHHGFGKVILGEYQGEPRRRTHEVCELFRGAGVDCEVTPDLERAHWEKLVWNIPFNGLGVAASTGGALLEMAGGPAGERARGVFPTDQLLSDPSWLRLVQELMAEIIRTARALGFAIPFEFAERLIERTRQMGSYKASTLIDFERGQPIELESLFLTPLAIAKRSGVAVPRLAALCRVLTQLDSGRSAATNG